jgi:hypothetical protein
MRASFPSCLSCHRDEEEFVEVVENIGQLKMLVPGGKIYQTDSANANTHPPLVRMMLDQQKQEED